MAWQDTLSIYEDTIKNLILMKNSGEFVLQLENALSSGDDLKNVSLSGGGLYDSLARLYEPGQSSHLATTFVEAFAEGLSEDPEFIKTYLSNIGLEK